MFKAQTDLFWNFNEKIKYQMTNDSIKELLLKNDILNFEEKDRCEVHSH